VIAIGAFASISSRYPGRATSFIDTIALLHFCPQRSHEGARCP
jgi:hypothetical protein